MIPAIPITCRVADLAAGHYFIFNNDDKKTPWYCVEGYKPWMRNPAYRGAKIKPAAGRADGWASPNCRQLVTIISREEALS